MVFKHQSPGKCAAVEKTAEKKKKAREALEKTAQKTKETAEKIAVAKKI